MQQIKPKILIVDDDTRILDLLKQFFDRNGFDSFSAISAEDAVEVISEQEIDLLILDVMLPGITGFEFSKQIKAKSKQTPIILLTALSEPDDRVRGLESGADDYITKPFEPKELILRATNLIELYKASKKDSNEIASINFGRLVYYFNAKTLKKNEEEISLSSTEIKLLEHFLKNKGSVISRDNISEIMGGVSDRSVDVQIVRLRQKIEEDVKKPKFLQTIRHEGYGFYI